MIFQDLSGEISTLFEMMGMEFALGPMNFASKARMIGSIPDDRTITGTLFFNVQS